MDWNRVEGNWKKLRGGVKERWGRLTDDDLTAIAGRREELEGKLQERYGYGRDRIRREIDEWRHSADARDAERDLSDDLNAIRTDIESLTSTLSRIAGEQLSRAQDKVIEKASQAENTIKQNPISVIAIAFGAGFLYGALTRR